MTFLKNLGFKDNIILEIENNIPNLLKEEVSDAKELVSSNIKFLQELGITNIEETFMSYADMFLMDTAKFQDVFNKYDREDLIKKIEKNVAIIEHL